MSPPHLARALGGAVNWAAVLAHELHQLDRDGDDAPWARAAGRIYRAQLPALRSLFAHARVVEA